MKFRTHILMCIIFLFCGVEHALSMTCPSLLTEGHNLKFENSKRSYSWEAPGEPNFFIKGDLVEGVLEFSVQMKNLYSEGRSKYRGKDVFDEMISHFGVKNILSIRARWSQGDNFASFRENLLELPEKKAALGTWTGYMASRYGFTRAKVVNYLPPGLEGGGYAEILFLRPIYDVRTPLIHLRRVGNLEYWDE